MHAVLLAVLALTQAVAISPFSGDWEANLATSRLRPNAQIRSEHLHFDVQSTDTVSIRDSVITTSGKEIGQGTTLFQVDGKPHPHDELMAGLTMVAQWNNPRRLETVLTRTNGMVDRVIYEISADGQTLTVTTQGPLGGQLIVFERH